MINYPNKKKITELTQEEKVQKSQDKKKISTANRGMDFEHAVN